MQRSQEATIKPSETNDDDLVIVSHYPQNFEDFKDGITRDLHELAAATKEGAHTVAATVGIIGAAAYVGAGVAAVEERTSEVLGCIAERANWVDTAAFLSMFSAMCENQKVKLQAVVSTATTVVVEAMAVEDAAWHVVDATDLTDDKPEAAAAKVKPPAA